MCCCLWCYSTTLCCCLWCYSTTLCCWRKCYSTIMSCCLWCYSTTMCFWLWCYWATMCCWLWCYSTTMYYCLWCYSTTMFCWLCCDNATMCCCLWCYSTTLCCWHKCYSAIMSCCLCCYSSTMCCWLWFYRGDGLIIFSSWSSCPMSRSLMMGICLSLVPRSRIRESTCVLQPTRQEVTLSLSTWRSEVSCIQTSRHNSHSFPPEILDLTAKIWKWFHCKIKTKIFYVMTDKTLSTFILNSDFKSVFKLSFMDIRLEVCHNFILFCVPS